MRAYVRSGLAPRTSSIFWLLRSMMHPLNNFRCRSVRRGDDVALGFGSLEAVSILDRFDRP